MHPDERLALDAQAAIQVARHAHGGVCVNDFGPGRMPTASLKFPTLADAKAFSALLMRAMRSAEAVDALDAQQAAAGFAEEADDAVLV